MTFVQKKPSQVKVYTLTQLNTSLENLIKKELNNKIFSVSCEIAKVNYSKGHCYLELADSKDSIKTAEAKGRIWKSTLDVIESELKAFGLKREEVIKENQNVVFDATYDFHRVYGLSLIIKRINPQTIVGDLEQKKRLVQKKILRKGLDKIQKNLYLGPVNRKIALIGSPKTSGFIDFMNELHNNNIYTKFQVKTFETTVQGLNAVEGIISAIEEANKWSVDCIVLVRGGGSKMDLQIFNDYNLCKAIASSNRPTLVGIGHESDTTLADVVAHKFFKTPTAVATFLYNQIGIFSADLSDKQKVIRISVEERINFYRNQTRHLQNIIYQYVDKSLKSISEKVINFELGILNHSNAFISDQKEDFQKIFWTIYDSTNESIEVSKSRLSRTLNYLIHASGETISFFRQEIDKTKNNINEKSLNSIKTDEKLEVERLMKLAYLKADFKLKTSISELIHVMDMITLIDPYNLFTKGYTISTVEGKDVRQFKASDLEGEYMKTYTEKLQIISKIKSSKPIES